MEWALDAVPKVLAVAAVAGIIWKAAVTQSKIAVLVEALGKRADRLSGAVDEEAAALGLVVGATRENSAAIIRLQDRVDSMASILTEVRDAVLRRGAL